MTQEPGSKSSVTSPEVRGEDSSSWVKVGAIAAFSAVLGGLAAAWVYRKTLTRLQEAGEDEIEATPGPEIDEEGV